VGIKLALLSIVLFCFVLPFVPNRVWERDEYAYPTLTEIVRMQRIYTDTLNQSVNIFSTGVIRVLLS
jgi:hypothetical protein